MSQVFLSRFTPSLMPAEALEGVFVQRERLAAHTTELIRDSVLGASKSHTLLVGPRGIGKTHLVSLIYHRLRALLELQDKMAVAWLREEEWGVASFLDLLRRILRALAEEDPSLTPRLAAVQESATLAAAERAARTLLVEIIGGRTLFVIAENLDDLFQGLGDEGQKRLRAFLQETRFTTILATTPSLFGGVSRQTSPFYGFFRVQHLPGLSLEESTVLLTKIARLGADASLEDFLQTPAGRARVRALHHLAGGNPRVYVIFSEFLTRESLDELVTPFLKMLDELTPYYQAKIRSLSAQQRKIVEILVEARGTLSVKEIGQRSFISPQTVSSQLKELREKGYVTAHAIGREAFYELQEPLMRLCLEVKRQRGDTIKLFVEFLRLWYTREELERRLAMLTPNAAFTASHLREALRLVDDGEDPRVAACLQDLGAADSDQDLRKGLQIAEELAAIRGSEQDWNIVGLYLLRLGQGIEAILAFGHASSTGTDPFAFMARVILLARFKGWEAGFLFAEGSLHKFRDDEAVFSITASVLLRHTYTSNSNTWRSRAERMTALFAGLNESKALDRALLSLLPILEDRLASAASRQLWLETWQQAARDIAEMQLPLRLLSAAVRYLNSGDPPDQRILLELPVEERTLLEPLLNAEKGDSSGATDSVGFP